MFLSDPDVLARGASGPRVGTPRCANFPRGPVVSSSLTHGCPFRPWATLGQLSSPKRGPLGPFPAPPPGQTVSASLWVWVSPVVPGTAWDSHRSAWTAIVSRRSHQPPRRVTTTNRVACREQRLRDAAVLRQAKERGTSTGPKRGSSRTIRAWPLRHRTLPADAGCIPFRKEGSSPDFRTGTDPHG